jgi:hypothetical protein
MELNENQQDYPVVSSLASHFGTNYTPTDDELLEIRNLLVEPSVRMLKLEVEMGRKAAEYHAIVEKHAKLMRLVADYRALASPMRRLPVDLLREVFYHCLPTEHNAILSYKVAPVVLTNVCSTWRAVALATPVLWASLHIPVPQPMSHNMFFGSDLEREEYRTSMMDALWKRTTAMKEWLARSDACKLSISLQDMSHPDLATVNTTYEEFLNTIISHSKRWRSMTFISSANYLRSISALTAEDVPALEEVVINMTTRASQVPAFGQHSLPPILNWAKSSFLSAPRLHRVSFINFSENVNMLPLRWRQLTHLSLTNLYTGWDDRENTSLANIAALLAKCPGLVSARLQISYQQPTPFAPPLFAHSGAIAGPSEPICRSPILLSNLTDLSLRNGGSDISSLFAMLDMPRLRTLSYYTNTQAEPASELIALVRRISGTLVEFMTNAAMFSREDFFSLLKAAHRLKRLINMPGARTGPPNPWERGTPHFDDVFLGMLVGKHLGLANLNTERDANLQEEKAQTAEEVADGYSYVLLPELESFDSILPVLFTDEALLECLKLRQSLGHGHGDSIANSTISGPQTGVEIAHSAPYSKFKQFVAMFCRKKTRQVYEDLPSLMKNGLALLLHYPPVNPINRFSPAEGIIDHYGMASRI